MAPHTRDPFPTPFRRDTHCTREKTIRQTDSGSGLGVAEGKVPRLPAPATNGSGCLGIGRWPGWVRLLAASGDTGRLWRRPWTGDKARDEPSPPPCLPLPGRPRRAAPRRALGGLALRVPGACLADRPPPAPTEQTLTLTLTLTTGGDRQRRRPAPLGKPSVDHVRGCMGGSVVEFSPATREARVRFPAHATRHPLLAPQRQLRATLPLSHLQSTWPKPPLLLSGGPPTPHPVPAPAARSLPPPWLARPGDKTPPAREPRAQPRPPTHLPCPSSL